MKASNQCHATEEIRLLEADLHQVLKWASREMMREIEKRTDGLSDMQFGFRKHCTRA